MSAPSAPEDKTPPSFARRAYQEPKLVVYGSVAKVTQKSGAVSDNATHPTRP